MATYLTFLSLLLGFGIVTMPVILCMDRNIETQQKKWVVFAVIWLVLTMPALITYASYLLNL